MDLRVAILLCMLAIPPVGAEPIRFGDYRLLDEGMSEGEILHRVGPPDHETVVSNDFVYRKIWYYLPDGPDSGQWLTVITFDANGRVVRIERTKP